MNTTETFKDYIKVTNDVLKKEHPELSEEVLNLIAPKQYIPPEKSTNFNKGILLIHGLLDSCASMSSLYHSFCKQGYRVNSILLPGHGTSPEELLDVSYNEWINCAQIALKDLEKNCSDITVIGLSAGATIASYLAHHTKNISRLILFAPAFKLLAKEANLIPKLQKFNELAPMLAKQWLTFESENDKAKYKSITTNCVYQIMSLIKCVLTINNTQPLDCPIFMSISTDDETVSPPKAIDFFKQQTNKNNQLLIYSNDHSISGLPHNSEIINSCLPRKKILNYSHVCIHVAPNHAIYGRKKEDSSLYLGALNNQNTLNYKKKLKRLTYNPLYNQLIEKISTFMKEN